MANSDGSYSSKLTVDSSDSTETRSLVGGDFECVSQDGSAKSHPAASCNRPAWFLPELQLLASSESTPEWTTRLISSPVGANQLVVQTQYEADKLNHRPLSVQTMTIDLTQGTSLPGQASFNIAADGLPNRSVHVIVNYSDYRNVSGVSIPYHIQKLINGIVVLDIVLTSASVN